MKLRVKPGNDLAEQIKEARKQADLTQVELAARLGVSPRTVQNWETNGIDVPRAKHRRAIAAFLHSVGEVAA